ncbi:hypothetical protein [Candidatus Enterovibrio escicola]|uniref:hypothetical protein n=1 Tax=Candidatus Enterovibrio escicola TaxID=1927127 RepID=UPI001680FE50|nr:hypothetical protein [Candidatus Enterovibrio escacola]
MANLRAGLITYSFQLKKPIMKITRLDKQALMQILVYIKQAGFLNIISRSANALSYFK